MKTLATSLVGAVLATFAASGGAMAQAYPPSYYDDMACRQWADSRVAPLRNQANANTVGGALLGAGLGAALGAAVGGGRGAGIGAASGAIVGTGAGIANAENSEAYLRQQYNAYYARCMAARTAPPPPPAGYAPPGYAPPGYAPPGYAPPGYAPPRSSASQLNQQELNRTQGAPPAYYPGYYPPSR